VYGTKPAARQRREPTVRRGPRRGRKSQVYVALARPVDQASEFLYKELPNELGKLPEVKEVVSESPQDDGKASRREPIELVVRFIKRIKPDAAERLVKKAIARVKTRAKRLTSSALRAERREHHRAKRDQQRSRRRVNNLERWLGQPTPA
jgi:hypothetical protein